jgi:hypothetical protein
MPLLHGLLIEFGPFALFACGEKDSAFAFKRIFGV